MKGLLSRLALAIAAWPVEREFRIVRRLMVGQRRLFKVAILLISTTLCFLVAEMLLRALGYYGERSLTIQETQLVDDPVLNWRHKPNSTFYSNAIVYRINERGFRDYIYPYERKPNSLRIFLAGDSVAFGTNVQVEDSYPKILESKLNGWVNSYPTVEVINYSMPGLSLQQKFHLVELYAQSYSPDIIILDYVLNDVEFESRMNSERLQRECFIELINLRVPCIVESVAKTSALAVFIKYSIEGILHKIKWEDRNRFFDQVESDYYHRLYAMAGRRDYMEGVFRRMRTYQRMNSTRIIVPIFPLMYDYDKYRWDDINTMIMGVCKKNDLVCLSLLEEYKKCRYNEMRVQRGDFTHPSALGNRVAAEAIGRVIMRELARGQEVGGGGSGCTS